MTQILNSTTTNGVQTSPSTLESDRAHMGASFDPPANGIGPSMGKGTSQPLTVLVIGAGLGGLTAAIALRRAGHKVTVFERSRLASEYGAAINVPPNATGILKRLGVDPAEKGAVELKWFTEYNKTGDSVKVHDFAAKSKIWQHKYLLAHRVDLHTQLRDAATSSAGSGTPVELITGCPVVDVDVNNATVTFKDGTTRQGDLVIGADGVHSRTRTKTTDKKPFHSGKSAYRFMLNRADVRKVPELKEVVERDGELAFWFDTERRIVMYPTRNNEVLNFVCIHPEKHQEEVGDSWHQPSSMQQLMKDFEGFDERALSLLRMADDTTLNSWTLTDMETVSRWHEGKLCLIGDAAHPFLPHQGQGAAQAMEDGVALGVILPLGVAPDEIADRLSLYQESRKERAEYIQEVTRRAGSDLSPEEQHNANKVMSFFNYNCGHDEYDSATQKLRYWLYKKQKDVFWRMPISFGPSPSPRQDFLGARQDSSHATFVTRSIKFKTSRTVAQNLLPSDRFSFDAPDTYADASLSATTLDKMDWLGGTGYNYVGLYLHNVRYLKQDSTVVKGDFLVVMWEDLTDPILTGREDLGFPKLYSEIDVQEGLSSSTVTMKWRTAEYLKLTMTDLKEETVPQQSAKDGVLLYKYIPATGRPGTADVEYPVYVPPNPKVKTTTSRVTLDCSIDINAHDQKALPTLHHVVVGVARLPIYEIEEGRVEEGTSPDDVMAAYRIE